MNFPKKKFTLICIRQRCTNALSTIKSYSKRNASILIVAIVVQWSASWHLHLRLQVRILSLLWSLFNFLLKILKSTISLMLKSGQSRGMGSSLTGARVIFNMQVNPHCGASEVQLFMTFKPLKSWMIVCIWMSNEGLCTKTGPLNRISYHLTRGSKQLFLQDLRQVYQNRLERHLTVLCIDLIVVYYINCHF